MLPELTNLLPEARIRGFRKRYFMRLGATALLLAACLIVLHGLLLLPTYFYVRGEVVRGTEQLALLQASAQTSEEQELVTRTQVLKAKIAALLSLREATTASAALRAVLAVPRAGVSLTGFSFSAPSGTGPARMQISGLAASRDALRSYASALGSLPFVTSADLPISAYAKESDIDFTITLSGTLRP